MHSKIYKYITGLYEAVGDVPAEDLSMYRYFKENEDVIGLIHLSTIKGSGYGKGRHGVPFSEESYEELSSLLSLYLLFNLACQLTLEVEENDYSVSNGYRVTKELVEKFFDAIEF